MIVALAAGGTGVVAAAGDAWLPGGLRVVAVLIYAVIVVMFLGHLRGADRRAHVWNAAHVLIALGMIEMFIRPRPMIAAGAIGCAVFAAATLGAVAFLVTGLVRGKRPGWLCSLAGVDLAAMTYMFAMPIPGFTWLTDLLVGWFVLQAAGWALRPLFVRADLGGSTAATVSSQAASTGVVKHDLNVLIALAAMNLGMAYMFLAMSPGTAMMHGQLEPMGSMPGM